MNAQIVTVNLIPDLSSPAVVKVSQYDVGRSLAFRIMDGMSMATLPQYWSAKVEGTKPSGLGFSETCTISGSTVTVRTTEAMTQECGHIMTEISFTHTGIVVGTANFILAVEPSPHPEGTTDGTTEEARTVLEQAQAAADAAAESAEEAAEAAAAVGDKYSAPIPASTVSGMVDHDKVYLYTGNETGYEYGNWYYWNGTAWTSGGAYGTGVEVYVDGTSLVINTNVQDGNEVSY